MSDDQQDAPNPPRRSFNDVLHFLIEKTSNFGPDVFVFVTIAVASLVAASQGGGWPSIVGGVAFASTYIFWQEHRNRSRFLAEFQKAQIDTSEKSEKVIDVRATVDEKIEISEYDDYITRREKEKKGD